MKEIYCSLSALCIACRFVQQLRKEESHVSAPCRNPDSAEDLSSQKDQHYISLHQIDSGAAIEYDEGDVN